MAKVVDILTRNELDTIRDNIDLLCDTICRITNKHTSGEDLIVKRCFADELMMEIIAEIVYRWDFKKKVYIPEVR